MFNTSCIHPSIHSSVQLTGIRTKLYTILWLSFSLLQIEKEKEVKCWNGGVVNTDVKSKKRWLLPMKTATCSILLSSITLKYSLMPWAFLHIFSYCPLYIYSPLSSKILWILNTHSHPTAPVVKLSIHLKSNWAVFPHASTEITLANSATISLSQV